MHFLNKASKHDDSIQEDKHITFNSYLLTAVFTLLSLAVILFVLKIYPFGDRTYLWQDSDQYFSIEHFLGSITGKNDIFYSWGNALGGNALSQLAYYAFSPFNIIYIILADHMMLAAHAAAYIKITACAISFCFCLNHIYGNDDKPLVKALFSTCYAFIGYMVYYGWNTSWMDGVILLPIMFAGIHVLAEKGKVVLYTLSLALALISNFYIGYMLCLCSVIFYLSILLMSEEKFWTGLKRTFLRYAFASVIGVGLSAFVFLPTYLSVPNTRKLSISDLFGNMHINIQPAEILSGLFTGQINEQENAPLIYASCFAALLAILFCISSCVAIKKKIAYMAMIFILFFSFENSFINSIWHGMSANASFNYRYSFIFSFVLLIMAYEAFLLVLANKCTKKEYLYSLLIFICIALFVMQNAEEKIQIKTFSFDIIFVIAITAVFIMEKQNSRLFAAFLTCCILFSVIGNSYYYLKDCETLSRNEYYENRQAMQNAFQTINDDSFYRMDKNLSYGRCDANLFDYKGISNYASTENVSNLDFMKKLGVPCIWMWARYSADIPMATESLLGVRYVITNEIDAKDYENIGSYDDIYTIYRNPYALQVVMPVNDISESADENLDDFEFINTIWRSISQNDEAVFLPNSVLNSSSEGENVLDISIENAGPVYLYIPVSSYTNIRVVTPTEEKTIQYERNSEIYYIGEYSAGDSMKVYFEIEDRYYDLDNIRCSTENRDVIRKDAGILNDRDITVTELSSSHLKIDYNGDNKSIVTTIPYDDGWTISDNGKEIAAQKAWGNFIAFNLDESENHSIEMIYRPVGFRIGLYISIISVLLLVLYEYAGRRLRNKAAKSTVEL